MIGYVYVTRNDVNDILYIGMKEGAHTGIVGNLQKRGGIYDSYSL